MAPAVAPGGRRVHVAGGGLAGLALGLALRRRGVPVTVHEAGAYPRHRVCGEFISGLSPAQQEALGVADVLAEAPRHVETAWFRGERAFFRARLPEAAIAVSRHELDARLAEKFTALGGELRCGERVEPAVDGWVASCGRARVERPRWLGLKAHFTGVPLTAGLEMHLGRGGYAGVTALAGGRVNVCALLPATSSGGVPRGERVVAQLEKCGLGALAARLRQGSCVVESVTGVTHFALGWHGGGGAVPFVEIGDRAAIIPPFTGHGMSMAFQSALVVAPHVARWSAGAPWAEARASAAAALRAAFAPRVRWAMALHPFLCSGAGQAVLVAAARGRLLPFAWLLRRVR